MKPLRQSTAVTVHVGPFVDIYDGYTPMTTGIAEGTVDEISIFKHEASGISISGASNLRHDTGGMGLVDLTSSHTDTLGHLRLYARDDSLFLPVWEDFLVQSANSYDMTVSGTVTNETIASEVTASGNAAGWNSPTIATIVASGNAENWNQYSDATLAKQNQLLTDLAVISGNLDTKPDIATIVASGDAEGWNSAEPTGVIDSNLVQIDGLTTSGNNATLYLKQLNVYNTIGNAIEAVGNPAGVLLEGFANGDYGLHLKGKGTGAALYSENAGGSGPGAEFVGGTFSGPGIVSRTLGQGPALKLTGGSNWPGIDSTGGLNADGIRANGNGTGNGMTLLKGTTGKDIDADEIDNIQSTVNTMSGTLDNRPDIATIVASGDAAGWGATSSLTLEGIANEVVQSGDASGWGAVSSLTLAGIANEVTTSGNAEGWADGSTATEVWAAGARTLTDPNSYKADVSSLSSQSSVNTISGNVDNLPTLAEIYNYSVDSKTTSGVLQELLAESQGRIIPSGSNWTYYAQDGVTPLFTLSESGVQRVRS